MYASLNELTDLMQQAGARIINGTELPNYKTTVSPHGWNWYGSLIPKGIIQMNKVEHLKGLWCDTGIPQ